MFMTRHALFLQTGALWSRQTDAHILISLFLLEFTYNIVLVSGVHHGHSVMNIYTWIYMNELWIYIYEYEYPFSDYFPL